MPYKVVTHEDGAEVSLVSNPGLNLYVATFDHPEPSADPVKVRDWQLTGGSASLSTVQMHKQSWEGRSSEWSFHSHRRKTNDPAAIEVYG